MDLCVLDEFRAQKTVQFLNHFLDGSHMPLRQKGRQTLKTDNLPCIILSNFSLEECYCNSGVDKLETLRCRLCEVYVPVGCFVGEIPFVEKEEENN